MPEALVTLQIMSAIDVSVFAWFSTMTISCKSDVANQGMALCALLFAKPGRKESSVQNTAPVGASCALPTPYPNSSPGPTSMAESEAFASHTS